MPISTLVVNDEKFIGKLRRHSDGFEEYNRTNVKKRLEFLADGGDIRELEGYEGFTEESWDGGVRGDLFLATDVEMKFIENPDPCRCLICLASPVCTALIMEEYELAKRLLEKYPLRKKELIKIYDETQMIMIMDSATPYNEKMHEIMVESFLAEVWEKIGDKIKPFWDSLGAATPRIVQRNVIQLPTLFGAYRDNRMYMEYIDAGIPRNLEDEEFIIDTKYDGSKLLEYLKQLASYNRQLFAHYIGECKFEFGQLKPETEFKLKLAIQRLAVGFFDGDEEAMLELLEKEVFRFELPRYQLAILNPNEEILFKHIKYCGGFYKKSKKLKHAFFDYMIRYFIFRACEKPELERYVGEFFDEDFPVMDYAVLRRHYTDCLEYTHVYTRLAKGRHRYHVRLDETTTDAKYMISMFGMLDEKPLDVDASWILSSKFSSYQERLYDIIFWLEDMERVEIDIPDGSLSYGWRDLDVVDIQTIESNLSTGVADLPLLNIDDRYFCMVAFIWKKICHTGDAELFTQAYKKGFIPESQIKLSLEKYGNDEFQWDKSLIPVMLGVAG